jgi:hypothetical protein
MRFGVTIPNNWGIADPRQVLAMGDSGLAVGPLIGGFVVARLGLPLLYDALAVCIVGALVVHRLASGGPVYAIRGIDAPRGGS